MRALGTFLIVFELFCADTATAGTRGSPSDRIPDQGAIQAPDANERSSADAVENKDDWSTTQQPNRTSAAGTTAPQNDDSPDPGKGMPNGSKSEDQSDGPY